MAIYENPNMMGKMTLQPGARGGEFEVNIPGYRGKKLTNRTNTNLNTASHETTNIKYGLDDRLAVEFTYGYAFGYNQMVAAKGRVVAVDPFLNIFDADTQKYDNALTLANGGVTVKFNKETNQWEEAQDADLAQLTVPNTSTGYFTDAKGLAVRDIRPANVPIGILLRNEYTRDTDAFNGIIPGAVNTDCMVELPYFVSEDKAKANPWGSVYGSLKPGDLVKSDTTGRITLSPLSDPTWLAGATIQEVELERQQVLGQIYEVRRELVPMGAAKYAQWALSDILQFEEFNPDEYRRTNRRGEDNIDEAPFETGKGPWGYDNTLTVHDLHMIASQRTNYDERMQLKYRFDFGIPGLTDGYNAIKTKKTQDFTFGVPTVDGKTPVVTPAGSERTFRLLDTNVSEKENEEAKIGDKVIAKNQQVKIGSATFTITYYNALQGIIQMVNDTDLTGSVDFTVTYTKRGRSGVPTQLDWDGCTGTVKILLQK